MVRLLSFIRNCHGLPKWLYHFAFPLVIKEFLFCRCGSVGQASSCKLKGRGFDAQSGHVPRLWVQSRLGHIRKATNKCFSLTLMFLFLSLSPCLPLSLIKTFFKNLKRKQFLLLHILVSIWYFQCFGFLAILIDV